MQVYAVVVGALSAVTCLAYFIPLVLRIAGFVAPVWNFILFVLWIALFGIFGKVYLLQGPEVAPQLTLVQMYIHEDPEGVDGIKRMKNAVWVDLASALLWLIATLASAAYWWKHRDSRSQFTGRAHV